MPLDLPTVNVIDAVWFVPADGDWADRTAALLAELGADRAALGGGIDLLRRRARGEHDWRVALAGQLLPNGRPCPPVRRYGDALLTGADENELGVPIVSVPPLTVALDVWGPGERGGEPGMLGLELVVHRQVVHPWRPGAVLWNGTVLDTRDPGHKALLRPYGDAFARVMARGCEVLEPVFALSDGLQPLGDFLAKAGPANVRHPAPEGARLADYAWPLTYWSADRLDDALRARLQRLHLPSRSPGGWTDGVDVEVRTLATGGVFLQVRHILGQELRGDRTSVETPLAEQLALRSNHLLYRA